MYTERFLLNRLGINLGWLERQRLEAAISDVRHLPARSTISQAGQQSQHITFLVEGITSRYVEDRKKIRQQVALHLPGEIIDLDAFPLKTLDHGIATITPVTLGIVTHADLKALIREGEELANALWFSTMLNGAEQRAWLFRLGRLDGAGRVAHFLCETNLRLMAAGLSDGRQFRLELTQSDIAEICGLTSVHVNRVLRQMREARLCDLRQFRVHLFEPERLAKRGQFDPAYLYIDPALFSSPLPMEQKREDATAIYLPYSTLSGTKRLKSAIPNERIATSKG